MNETVGNGQIRTVGRGMVARLVIGILAVDLLPLGFAFVGVGLLGEQRAFAVIGAALAAVGLLLGLLWLRLGRNARAARVREEAARQARARATVVDVALHQGTRIGSLVSVTLTVRFPARNGEVTLGRRLLVSPLMRLEPHQQVDVAYDPDDPTNFIPLA